MEELVIASVKIEYDEDGNIVSESAPAYVYYNFFHKSIDELETKKVALSIKTDKGKRLKVTEMRMVPASLFTQTDIDEAQKRLDNLYARWDMESRGAQIF